MVSCLRRNPKVSKLAKPEDHEQWILLWRCSRLLRSRVTSAIPKTFTLFCLSSTPQVSKLEKPEDHDNYI